MRREIETNPLECGGCWTSERGRFPLLASFTRSDGKTNTELIARCRAAEPRAWTDFYQTNLDFVCRTALQLRIEDCELEDVCQEAFLVAFRKIGDFRGGRLPAWLYRIVTNIVSDRHRRARLQKALRATWGLTRDDFMQAGPNEELTAQGTRALVGQVLALMSPRRREVLILFELQGLSVREIARRVRCKTVTVRTRLHRARKDFQRLARKRAQLLSSPEKWTASSLFWSVIDVSDHMRP